MGLDVFIGEFCEGLRNMGDIIWLLVAMGTRNLIGLTGVEITGSSCRIARNRTVVLMAWKFSGT